jgi:integrase
MTLPLDKPPSRLKFSKLRLLSLPWPKTTVAYYYDTETRGLAISVGTSGRKSFFLYRKVSGAPRRIPIGLFPDISVEQARTAAERLNGEIASGENTLIKATTKKGPTFKEVFADYMEKHSRPTKVTWKEDEQMFERNLTGKRGWIDLSKMKLKDVGVHEVKELHRAMTRFVNKKGKEVSRPIAANRTLALVSSIFTHAIREGIFDELNPCRAVKKNRHKSRERFLQRDEVEFFFDALRCDNNKLIVDFIEFALLTGVRRGNILAIKWDQISWGRSEWCIPVTKNGESQTIPVPAAAMEILIRRRDARPTDGTASEFVFAGRGVTGHLVEPKNGWARICHRATALKLVDALLDKACFTEPEKSRVRHEAIGVPKQTIQKYKDLAARLGISESSYDLRTLHFHDLRRTVGSWMASSGASLPLIGKVLNHKSAQSTQVYARFMLDPVRNALEQVAGALRDASASEPSTTMPSL